MAKISFHKGKGLAPVLRKSKPIASVPGEGYEKLHTIAIREIHNKNREYAEVIRQAEGYPWNQ